MSNPVTLTRLFANRHVTLTKSDWVIIEALGTKRNSDAQAKNRKSGVPEKDNLRRHLEGAAYECAASVFFCCLRWHHGVNTFSAVDIGKHTEIKGTSNPRGRLFVDTYALKDDVDYVQVTGIFPEYTIVGFLRGDEIRQMNQLTTFTREDGSTQEVYYVEHWQFSQDFEEMLDIQEWKAKWN